VVHERVGSMAERRKRKGNMGCGAIPKCRCSCVSGESLITPGAEVVEDALGLSPDQNSGVEDRHRTLVAGSWFDSCVHRVAYVRMDGNMDDMNSGSFLLLFSPFSTILSITNP
jgi:hypothetical protein